MIPAYEITYVKYQYTFLKEGEFDQHDVASCKELLKEIGGEKDPFLKHVRKLRQGGKVLVISRGRSAQHALFLQYCSDYLIYSRQLIDALPDQKEDIISKFVNLFRDQIRQELHNTYSVNHDIKVLLDLAGLEMAPFEVVQALFQSFPMKGEYSHGIQFSTMFFIHSRHVQLFGAQQRLVAFLEEHYKITIYYTLEGDWEIHDNEACHYSCQDMQILASLGISARNNWNWEHDVCLTPTIPDLIYSYYSSECVIRRSKKELISSDLVRDFKEIRQNIQDCIESTYYGEMLGYIVQNEIIGFVYDVVLSVPVGTEMVHCDSYSYKEIITGEYYLSKHPLESCLENNRKRHRNELPFFGVESECKWKKANSSQTSQNYC